MRENRTYGLEGGEVILPDPYRYNDLHFFTQELRLNKQAWIASIQTKKFRQWKMLAIVATVPRFDAKVMVSKVI